MLCLTKPIAQRADTWNRTELNGTATRHIAYLTYPQGIERMMGLEPMNTISSTVELAPFFQFKVLEHWWDIQDLNLNLDAPNVEA